MEIKPTYVTFEQAKLLKEKGFNEYCSAYYDNKKELYTCRIGKCKNSIDIEVVSAPEQWQVVEFLRIKHDIFISIEPNEKRKFKFNIYTDKVLQVNNLQISIAETPQEAYSAAFDYILTKLI
jgi:hypothetical protein